jgi:hypothetical protein
MFLNDGFETASNLHEHLPLGGVFGGEIRQVRGSSLNFAGIRIGTKNNNAVKYRNGGRSGTTTGFIDERQRSRLIHGSVPEIKGGKSDF